MGSDKLITFPPNEERYKGILGMDGCEIQRSYSGTEETDKWDGNVNTSDTKAGKQQAKKAQ